MVASFAKNTLNRLAVFLIYARQMPMHICFLLLVYLFLHFLVVGSVR